MAISAQFRLLTSSWTAGSNLTASRNEANRSNSSFNSTFVAFCGRDSGNAGTDTMYINNKTSWSTGPASSGGIRAYNQYGNFNNLLYAAGGLSTGSGLPIEVPEKYNGSSWASYASPSFAIGWGGITKVSQFSAVYMVAGVTTLGAAGVADYTRKMNTAESASTTTNSGTLVGSINVAEFNGKLFKMIGTTTTAANAVTAIVKSFNDSTWTTETVYPAATMAAGSGARSEIFIYGGEDASGVFQNSTYSYNGSSWTTRSSLTTATGGGPFGGAF